MSQPEIIPLDQHPQLANAVPDYVPGLGLNQTRLERLALWGCFDPDVQFKVESGESTTYSTTIVGNLGNMALGGASGTKTPQLSRPDYDIAVDGYAPDGLKHAYCDDVHTTPRLTVRINSTALQERVQAGGKARDPKLWSRHLSQAIGNGVKEAAWSHLVSKTHIGELLVDGTMTAIFAALMAGGIAASKDPSTASYIDTPLMGETILNAWRNLRSDKAVSPKQVCWSLIPAVHLDRVGVVAGLAKVLPVVKPL